MQKSGRIVRYTAEELADSHDQSDWDRARALTHEEIEASVDEADEGSFDFSSATTVMPNIPALKQQITVRIDGDVLDWFKATGKGYQTRINAVLRQYVETRKPRS